MLVLTFTAGKTANFGGGGVVDVHPGRMGQVAKVKALDSSNTKRNADVPAVKVQARRECCSMDGNAYRFGFWAHLPMQPNNWNPHIFVPRYPRDVCRSIPSLWVLHYHFEYYKFRCASIYVFKLHHEAIWRRKYLNINIDNVIIIEIPF